MTPSLIKAVTLQSACIVLPKCRPWCTRGSVDRLLALILEGSTMEMATQKLTYAFFLGPSCEASWGACFLLAIGSQA